MRVGEIRVGKGVAVRLRQPCGFQRGSYGTALVRGARIRATRRAVSVVVVWELSDETCGIAIEHARPYAYARKRFRRPRCTRQVSLHESHSRAIHSHQHP